MCNSNNLDVYGGYFDASSSWNGYNHQGRLALLLSIRFIKDLYNPSLGIEENKKIISEYFVELEYLEDFSFGRIVDDTKEYCAIHQVKDKGDTNIKAYKTAILNLIYKAWKHKGIKEAYLHTTKDLSLSDEQFSKELKEFLKSPNAYDDILTEIKETQNSIKKKKKLCEKNVGAKSFFRKMLEQVNQSLEITEINIDSALLTFNNEILKRKRDFQSLDDVEISKVKIFNYSNSACEKKYCDVNEIENMIKEEYIAISKKIGLPEDKYKGESLKHRYWYLSDELNSHVIERDLDIKENWRDREKFIRLDQIFDWLITDLTMDDKYVYLSRIKELFIKCLDIDYKRIISEGGDVSNLIYAKRKIEMMDLGEIENFLTKTCPHNYEGYSFDEATTYFSTNTISSSFLFGLEKINEPISDDKDSVTFLDKLMKRYILSVIYSDGRIVSEETVCCGIVKNKALSSQLMDGINFISGNISCDSVYKKAFETKISKSKYDVQNDEHIAHPRQISIVTVDDFVSRMGDV